MTTIEERDRPTGSFNSFGPTKKKNKEIKCRSQPFLKPLFKLKLSEFLTKVVCKKLHFMRVDPTGTEPEDFTLDESKLVLIQLAQELDRIMQTDFSLLTKNTEDGSSLEERQAFILQLAQDISDAQELNRTTGLANVPEGNMGEGCQPEPEQDERLKKAFCDLSTWTWTLKGMDEDCLESDVREVIKDMRKQWKKGKLTNILPVLYFVIWSILQPNGQKGSIVKHWNRNTQLFKSRADQHVPDSVWKLITKTTAMVRLDPSTAHPYLELSEDGREVKMKQIVESNKDKDPMFGFRRTKQQFDGWPCVLGQEGFVSGTHYWEVDVRDKAEWRIGVVRESASRNGFKDLNTKTDYMTLKLQLGQIVAMTVPVTKLDRRVPSVLGVLLDVEEGQVSFYDVGHRSHIYSFHVSFECNKKVFPVFGTVETDKKMRIVK